MRLIILLQHPGAGPFAPAASQFGEKAGRARGAVVLGVGGAGPGRNAPASTGGAEPIRTAGQNEADRLALLSEAFKGAPLDEHRDVVRRLLTHPDSERILCGLVRSFFSGVTFDVDEAAAAARRERTITPSLKSTSPGAAGDEPTEDGGEDEGPANARSGKRKRRRRRNGRAETATSGAGSAAAEESSAAEESPAPEDEEPALEAVLDEPPPVPEDMTTLYFNVGKRDGLEPRDLATLLVNTCGLGAEDIGRVRVKDRHTFVGVPTERADAVISSLQGQSIKNRALQVERARS